MTARHLAEQGLDTPGSDGNTTCRDGDNVRLDAPEQLAAFDLRMRSLDRKRGEPIDLCSSCTGMVPASWSVWLHTPEWGPGDAGDTRVLCTHHALQRLSVEARRGR